eukprot:s2538_g25.t1
MVTVFDFGLGGLAWHLSDYSGSPGSQEARCAGDSDEAAPATTMMIDALMDDSTAHGPWAWSLTMVHGPAWPMVIDIESWAMAMGNEQ